MSNFKVRHDNSTSNIPVVGYQDGVDAQDVVMWGIKKITETAKTTDAQGILTVSNPIIDISHDFFVDGGGVGRERLLDANDITITGGVFYIGAVDPRAKTIKLYTDAGKTTLAANASGITVEYYTLAGVTVDANGAIKTTFSDGQVAVTSMPALPAGANKIGDVGVKDSNGPMTLTFTTMKNATAFVANTLTSVWAPSAGKVLLIKGFRIQNTTIVTDTVAAGLSADNLVDTDIEVRQGSSTIIASFKLAGRRKISDTTNKIFDILGEAGEVTVDLGDGLRFAAFQAFQVKSSLTGINVQVWGMEVDI